MPLGLAAARRRRPTLEAAVRRPSDQSGPISTTWPRPLRLSTVAFGTRFSTTSTPGRAVRGQNEFGNDRRGLQPAAGRRRRNHVAGLIDDVEMHGVAAHFAEAADGRLARAHGADGLAMAFRPAQFYD